MSTLQAVLAILATAFISQTWSAKAGGDLNPWLLNAEYAVRGEVPVRAAQLKARLAKGEKLPFDELVYCNIGNPQALGQQPITFLREVLSLVVNPALLTHVEASGDVAALFSADAVVRAKKYLAAFSGGGVGAYTDSQGIEAVRAEVAAFIEQRDGFAADASEIFLTDGASAGVKMLMTALIRSENGTDGVMAPIPQYPLYSAVSTLANARLVGYYLDESRGWELTVDELERAHSEAVADGVTVRALVVINPGNPTGGCLSKASMLQVIRFCAAHDLVLMADEVYQENIYKEGAEFVSFKKAVMELKRSTNADDQAAANKVRLVSFHSTSKGFFGECGLRGGYFELFQTSTELHQALYKLASISLCPNTHGQIAVGVMINPPVGTADAAVLYEREKTATLSSLKQRAKLVSDGLNKLAGVSCNPADGAMYAFPRLELPAAAVAAARTAGKQPDAFYCLEALESTGIVMVPGSGFGQVNGTWHFRTTFLPPLAKIPAVIERLAKFHSTFMTRYAKTEL